MERNVDNGTKGNCLPEDKEDGEFDKNDVSGRIEEANAKAK